jgi:hypothetical protein
MAGSPFEALHADRKKGLTNGMMMRLLGDNNDGGRYPDYGRKSGYVS